MSLPWVRLDANIGTHDKVLTLVSDTAVTASTRWQALASYMVAIAWSGGQGTDGRIPTAALPMVHGTKTTARLLMKHGLWDESPGGWQIRNFHTRQELEAVSAGKRAAQRAGALKGNCIRHHGPDCGCWRQEIA